MMPNKIKDTVEIFLERSSPLQTATASHVYKLLAKNKGKDRCPTILIDMETLNAYIIHPLIFQLQMY